MAGESVEIDYEDEMLRAKFNEFDLDGDGSITKKELKTVLRSMGSINNIVVRLFQVLFFCRQCKHFLDNRY